MQTETGSEVGESVPAAADSAPEGEQLNASAEEPYRDAVEVDGVQRTLTFTEEQRKLVESNPEAGVGDGGMIIGVEREEASSDQIKLAEEGAKNDREELLE
mmetsp:Transcript_33696/g.52436  ORF Transcript_33696/g.52436 Transcript_33696/m.52436 type:complete len:101 (-) Transcript_33696:107-409(-)